ncbi:hypothetical protein CC1G_02118 [Coprinopsis cinerea okayama7|uniref:Enoyl reductase (ER) domain-containing protein n=1 Tax=Coprinopsis cinerea (strain Okayama-7 / 130 / ATCC MYA-4618 / FGSC 9003) TaxID=240176 RepID=A8NK92_COPC7|nr:hypothetical protein CC1G_02118 [Coprinopsis cinerea okayama7\|eukprot:XP_001834382.1 hypothetical protein CC1G_02118 [Coprinopsis cinerea okayama7\
MSTNTQKALVLEKLNGDFVVTDWPIPVPQAGEVLVKIEATALNPVDWKIQKIFGQFIKDYPAILGVDISGEVVELGEGVTNVKKGDKVFFQGQRAEGDAKYRNAGFQQYTITDVRTIAKIPSNISITEAAAIPAGFITSPVGLFLEKPLGAGLENAFTTGKGRYSNQPIVILGGSSAVGQFAIQVARLSGFNPIVTTSSLKHTEFLKSLGATHVVDRGLPSEDTQKAIKAIVPTPVTLVYDAVSTKDTQELGIKILAPNGTIVLTLPPEVEASDGKEVIFARAPKEFPRVYQLLTELYPKLTGLLEERVIKPIRVEVLPGGLNGIVAGLKRLEEGTVSGTKLVVLPQETV